MEGQGMTSNNEESAFPRSRLGSDADGMTLRDYFAAKAMQGILAGLPEGSDPDVRDLARDSYKVADAMLKIREKKNDPRRN